MLFHICNEWVDVNCSNRSQNYQSSILLVIIKIIHALFEYLLNELIYLLGKTLVIQLETI